MFEVIPEDYTESSLDTNNKNTTDASVIQEYSKRAKEDGFSSLIIERAVSQLDSSIDSYEVFCAHLYSVMRKMEIEKQEEEDKQKYIKKSIKFEIDYLRSIKDKVTYLNDLIYKHYNTTAVSAIDLVESVKDREELDLDLYEAPVYSVIIQIEKDWIKDVVIKLLCKWETSPEVKDYIDTYMSEHNYDKINKKDIISVLPDVIRNECSPDTYKQYKAIELIHLTENKGTLNIDEDTLEDDEEKKAIYIKTFEDCFKNGVPFYMAKAIASKAVKENSKDNNSIVNELNNITDKLNELKDKAVNKLDESVKDDNKSKSNTEQRQPIDVSPEIPKYVTFSLIHMVISLLFWIIFGSDKALLLTIGLLIASIGLYKKHVQEPGYIKVIVGGYVLAFLALIIMFK